MKHKKQSMMGIAQLGGPGKMLTEIEVRQIRELAEAHNSIKSIARQTHKSRNTIRRYLRGEAPGGRILSESMR